uniref:T9SS type A sorting domain-containing protein n=1 Tax=Candidatus Symbiothrix dinenymphae TaxID=467085 RepID=UPI00070279C9
VTPLVAQNKARNGTPVAETATPELTVTNNTLHIKNATIGSKLEIITIVGNKVLQIEMQTTNSTYELNLPKAIYIFKLEGVVRKFVIK